MTAQGPEPFSFLPEAGLHPRSSDDVVPPAGGPTTAPSELPMTWVACGGCGELIPLHDVECEHCGLPHPRTLHRRPA